MTTANREARVLHAVVTLVDSLLDEFDVVDLLTELTRSARSCSTSPPPACCWPTPAADCT